MLRLLALSLLIALPLRAQPPAPARDSLFLRAQRLVSEGQGQAGRALVDSLLAAAPVGSRDYVEALYWRASLAATAAEAERDYQRLVIEHPLSPRAEDALLRLAQLEIARGDRQGAMRHLERLVLEHPTGPARPRASYWMARVHFDAGNVPRGCAALATARAHLDPSDVELRNQVDYYGQRCLGVDTTDVARAAPAPTEAPPPAPAPAAAPRADAPPPAARGAYTVQVAALNTREAAQQLRDRLRAAGYEARVAGAGRLWRVRVGHYATRGAASAVASELRAKGIAKDAFPTESEGQ